MSGAADSDLVLLERDGAVATLTINRPDKLNALNRGVLAALRARLEALGSDHSIRCVVLTGAGGKAFVAGADIAEMKDLGVDEARAFSREGHDTFAALENLNVPVIAAVNGFALGGGCELALACDFMHASAKARFGQPEVKLGVIPGFGGTQRLARRVGIGMARELVYSGGMIRADEALRIGLVNAVHEPDALMDEVGKLARTIAGMGPISVSIAKEVLREGEGHTLPDANALEVDGFAACFGTADQTEGMSAFLEKREAEFQGK